MWCLRRGEWLWPLQRPSRKACWALPWGLGECQYTSRFPVLRYCIFECCRSVADFIVTYPSSFAPLVPLSLARWALVN